MSKLTVNIDNKKSEKAVRAVLDALGLSYDIVPNADHLRPPLNKAKHHTHSSTHDLLGKISKRDVTLMENAIQIGCKQSHVGDWE